MPKGITQGPAQGASSGNQRARIVGLGWLCVLSHGLTNARHGDGHIWALVIECNMCKINNVRAIPL